MREAPCLFLAALCAAACGHDQAVSSTTTAHRKPDYAPPAPERSVVEATGNAPIPPPEHADEILVFVKAGSLWRMGPDGNDPFRLTAPSPTEPDAWPALSPRGDQVAFVKNDGGARRIHLAALDGTGAGPAVAAGEHDLHPAFSPDGQRLAFVRLGAGGQRYLYVVDLAEDAAPRRIVAGQDERPDLVGWPAWSPDGKRIAFSADRSEGAGTGLWLVAPDGSGLQRLTRPLRGESWVRDLRASWSPDGAHLAFASNRHGSSKDDADDLDIYTVRVETQTLTRLTRDPGVADDPCYAPDGNRIYFTSTRDAVRPFSTEIFVMPAPGGEQRRLTRDEIPQNAMPSAGRSK